MFIEHILCFPSITGGEGKSLHTNNPNWQVIVYNPSKSGVMVDISFEDKYAAVEYYNIAIKKGFPATLIELNKTADRGSQERL